jgi:hypothetical protein
MLRTFRSSRRRRRGRTLRALLRGFAAEKDLALLTGAGPIQFSVAGPGRAKSYGVTQIIY